MKKRIFVVLAMALILAGLSMTAADTSAAGKSMTVYNDVLKEGNTVYCNSGIALYKVNLKNGRKKVLKDMKRGADDYYYSCMKKKGNWLYFTEAAPTSNILCRINVSSRKYHKIMSKIVKDEGIYDEDAVVENYVISGSRIYCNGGYNSSGKFNKIMGLNGRGKKNSKVKIHMKKKRTNAKGYKIIKKRFGEAGYYSYLKTPKKTYYPGKSYW